MRRRTHVFFVCSPHSRTGATTTARLLTDYYLTCNMRIEGFDTDARDPFFNALFPDITQVVDVADVKGQISLFDRLLVADDTPKIVDVWNRSYEQLFSTIAEIGFFEEARSNGVEPVILFQADSSESAVISALTLVTTWPDLWLTVVHNDGAAPLGPEALDILARYPSRGKFVIPALEGRYHAIPIRGDDTTSMQEILTLGLAFRI